MTALTDSSLARMLFTVTWTSDNVLHEEHYHAADVNMWRDIFPDAIRQKLIGCNAGDKIKHSISADAIIGSSKTSLLTLPLAQWHPPIAGYSQPSPLPGRYYPQGFLRGVSGIFPQTLTPMLIVGATSKTFTVDLNHPLSGRQIEVEIELEEVSQLRKERGGRCSDRLLEALDNGPGMQARIASHPITFDKKTAYQRADQGDDLAFYSEPRLVSHIDSQAKNHLAAVIERFLQPGSKVLDLMASVDSHLPEDHGMEVVGLGMNSEEMSVNKDLAEHMIHDLNADPRLPYPDKSFDAVLCNLSIEYLKPPQKVIRDAARVLKPAGTLLVSFSNRWFPPKVTKLWTELHEFERMGYILQFCWPHFDNLKTLSFRNWPRPVSDKYFPQMQTSDPLFVITGKVRI